ncbi:hypothetical protein [Microbulbifer elongatus]|uniref:hypothetical protein n=1 Tax=Microbulbifer elongatus TaxID=86173 RepID=UPI001E59F69B|nr:hypothetical protein [Microbulbifer elongatus]
MKLENWAWVAIASLCLVGCSGGGSGSSGASLPESNPDTTPDTFTIIDVDNAPTDTLITSQPVVITGIDSPSSIAVEGGQYSINSGEFTEGEGQVTTNDEVRIRVKSSEDLESLTVATLTVGGISDQFDVVTRSDEVTPEVSILFPVLQDTWVYRPNVIIRGVASDNRGIEAVYINGELADTEDQFANWQLQVAVAQPFSEFEVSVVDVDGNTAELAPLKINAYHGYRATGSMAIDVQGNRLFAGPNPSRIDLSTFSFHPYENTPKTVSEMVFDTTRSHWYARIDDEIVEISPESGEILREFLVNVEYAKGLEVDEASGKIYWDNLGEIYALDPASGVTEHISGAVRGTGLGVGNWSQVLVNDQDIYLLTYIVSFGEVSTPLLKVDPSTGDRILFRDLYVSEHKITRIIAAASHPTQPYIYIIAKSELAQDWVKHLYRIDLASGEIDKIFDMSVNGDSSLDLESASLEIDHLGNLAYVLSESTDHLYTIDLDSGEVSQVSSEFRGEGPPLSGDRVDNALAYDSVNNRLLTFSSSPWSMGAGKLMGVDLESGDRQILSGPERGSGPAFSQLIHLATSASGDIYVVDQGDTSIKKVDPISGNRTVVASELVGCCEAITSPTGIEVNPAGTKAVLLDGNRVLTLDLMTGNRALLSDEAGNEIQDIGALASDFEAGYAYGLKWSGGDPAVLYRIDLETGDRELLLSDFEGQTFPGATAMSYDPVRNKLMLTARFEWDRYYEIDLDLLKSENKFFPDGDFYFSQNSLSALIGVDGRLFAIANNPNFVAELDPETSDLVVISQ